MKQIRRSYYFLLILLSGVVYSACAPRAVSYLSGKYDPTKEIRVALVGFDSYPGWEGSGEIFAGTFEKYLLKAGYRLVERRHISKILKEKKLSLGGLTSPRNVKILGKILGADALVFGNVNEFTVPREQTVLVNTPQFKSHPIFKEIETSYEVNGTTVHVVEPVISGYTTSVHHKLIPRTESFPAQVGLSARLVDVATGEVLWSASSSGKAYYITRAVQEASSSLMRSVSNEIAKVAKR